KNFFAAAAQLIANLPPGGAVRLGTAHQARRSRGSHLASSARQREIVSLQMGGHSMPRQEILDQIQKYTHPFRITNGKKFQLRDFDPGDTRGLQMDKGEAAELLRRGTQWLAEEQDMLYAQDRWSLLLIFQAMDAAGKDSTIRHVMSGVNPQGCQVSSFKQPS